ncbi:MAG: hypothetical protein CPSOU_6696 [uncultured Paraburkholderia sp.]|nr:MAG: hypothetical protein CPSOU_6696 [uncultured Paraburkholderia sp.]
MRVTYKTAEPERLHARELASTATPIAISFMAESAVLLTNTYLAGRMGVLSLAAIGLGAGILYPLTFAGAGLASTSSALAAPYANSVLLKRRVLISGAIVCLAVTPLFIAVSFGLLYYLAIFDIDKELLRQSSHYMLAATPLVPLVLIFSIYRGILTVEAKSSTIAHASYLSVGINALLAPLLAFFMNLGIAGLAASTAICTFSMVAYVMFLTRNWKLESANVNCSCTSEIISICKRYLVLGVPVAFIGLLESGMFLVLTGFAASFGVGLMAAHALAISISDVVSALAFGIGEASTARLALYRARTGGVDDWPIYRATVGLAFVVGAIAAFSIYVLQRHILLAFVSANYYGYASEAFYTISPTFCLFVIFDSIQSVQYRALKGVEDVRIPLLLTSLSYWMTGVLVGIWLSTQTKLGRHGIWIGLLAGVTTAAVLLHLRSIRCLRSRSS